MRSLLSVLHVLGSLLALFALFFVLPIVTAIIYSETAVRSFMIGALLVGAAGLLLRAATSRFRAELKPRDGYLLVGLSWLVVAAAATVPLLLEMPHLGFTHAFFETMSGLSTTGATVLSGLDYLPHSINLWRHALSWLGGMGIIVLAVAVLPMLGVGGMQMYRAEAPGPVKDAKLTPRITETAKLLWLVYAGFTALCAIALNVAGMPVFDAICHAFSTMALGGFSTHDASVAYFDSPRIEAVLSLFMVVASLNFATHFVAVRRGTFDPYLRDPETRFTLLALLVGVLAVAAFLVETHTYLGFGQALRHASFSVISIATDCGFSSTDFGQWPIFAPMFMLFLSCVTVSTGSTGGGIKMFRTLVLAKQSLREMFTLVHPQAVVPLKIAGQVVPNRVVYAVLAFIFLYFMTIVVLTFALLASGLDFVSALTAIIACINNAGPGLNLVGPASNYAALNPFQEWLCVIAMFLGRIEILTVLVLFTPAFWRR